MDLQQPQVLVDGPSEKAPVPRQQVALAKLSLTPIVIAKLPRATGVGHVAKKWEEAKVQETFDESAWAKKRAAMQKRRGLNDFERFKVMKMRKQVCCSRHSSLAGEMSSGLAHDAHQKHND
jgi:large subunit ribosomal protein L14e